MLKKTVFFFTIMALLVFCCSGVYANITPDSQYLIQDMSSSLAPTTSGDSLLVYGNTYTYFTVDEVSVTVYLQHWNGSSWSDVGNPITKTKYNERRVLTSAERVVAKNELYRTRSIHQAKTGGMTETKYFYSNSYYYQ
jgi:hypothetical protein